jgi:hypothetical protein
MVDIGNAIKGRQQAATASQNATTENLVAQLGRLSFGLKALMTIACTGIAGAIRLGIKTMLARVN